MWSSQASTHLGCAWSLSSAWRRQPTTALARSQRVSPQSPRAEGGDWGDREMEGLKGEGEGGKGCS
eukprot:2383071-Pleurochrysis_carterae.AAC.1